MIKKIRYAIYGTTILLTSVLPLTVLSCAGPKKHGDEPSWKKTYYFTEEDLTGKIPDGISPKGRPIYNGYQTVSQEALLRIKQGNYDSFALGFGDGETKIQRLPDNFWDAFPNMTEIIPKAFFIQGFTTIKIPKRIKKIHYKAFAASALVNLRFEPNSELEWIGDQAFVEHSMKEIDLPASVKYIGYDAFRQNYNSLRIILRNSNLEKYFWGQGQIYEFESWNYSWWKNQYHFYKKVHRSYNIKTSFGALRGQALIRVLIGNQYQMKDKRAWISDEVWHTPSIYNEVGENSYWQKGGLDESDLDKD